MDSNIYDITFYLLPYQKIGSSIIPSTILSYSKLKFSEVKLPYKLIKFLLLLCILSIKHDAYLTILRHQAALITKYSSNYNLD